MVVMLRVRAGACWGGDGEGRNWSDGGRARARLAAKGHGTTEFASPSCHVQIQRARHLGRQGQRGHPSTSLPLWPSPKVSCLCRRPRSTSPRHRLNFDSGTIVRAASAAAPSSIGGGRAGAVLPQAPEAKVYAEEAMPPLVCHRHHRSSPYATASSGAASIRASSSPKHRHHSGPIPLPPPPLQPDSAHPPAAATCRSSKGRERERKREEREGEDDMWAPQFFF